MKTAEEWFAEMSAPGWVDPDPKRFKIESAAEFCADADPAAVERAAVELKEYRDNGRFKVNATRKHIENVVYLDGDTIETSRPRFEPCPPGEFTAGPPQEWLVRGVLPRAALAVIYGASGSGKSFLTLDMCAALTRGIPWNGKRTRRCKVTYIAAEGAGGFKKRMQVYAMKHGVGMDVLPWVIADTPHFLSIDHPKAIIDGLKTTGQSDVVVVDVLSAVMAGGDENSGKDIGKVIDYCKLIHRETGALVILIHHSGKDEAKGARGWSGLKAAADAEIEVTRNGDARKFKVSKQKDDTDGEITRFKLERIALGRNEFNEEESSCVVSFDVKEQRVDVTYKPREGYESAVMGIVDAASHGAPHAVKEIIAKVKEIIPFDGERDRRERTIGNAITKLAGVGLLEVVPDTGQKQVRKPGASEATNDPFQIPKEKTT